jgi:dTDP-4-dehydrorhamnose reductase
MKITDKRILVLGCGGMLGQAVFHTLNANNELLATDIELNEKWLEFLDVRDTHELLKVCASFSPDLIINLAACTDLEYCENNPEASYITNGLGQENVCLCARKYDIPVVYISTAGVFDGSREFYNDFDLPNPVSIYGKSKYHGELHTVKTLQKYFIFRAGWMMGGLNKDKKFVMKIFDQLQKGKREINIVNDKSGSPTYTWDFAKSMEKILCTEYYGLYNMVCEGSCNRFELTNELVKDFNLADSVKINLVSSEYFKKDYYAPRPSSEQLVNLKLKARNLMFMRDWRICLKEYSEQFPSVIRKSVNIEL